MSEEVVGTIVLSIDGVEYDCTSCNPSEVTGNRPVPTMNRQRRTKYVAKGNKAYSLSIETVIPLAGSIDWSSVEDARLTIESEDGSFRETYIDCWPQEIGTSTGVEANNAGRSISLFALDKIVE